MALRRSVMRMAERADVQPALKKLWKKHYKIDGQVTQTLSPFEQQIIEPLIKYAAKNALQRIINFAFQAGPGLGICYGIYTWAEWKHKQLAIEHRH